MLRREERYIEQRYKAYTHHHNNNNSNNNNNNTDNNNNYNNNKFALSPISNCSED